MYIYKMVFVERDEISEDVQQFLENNGLLSEVDYGNCEISSTDFKWSISNDFDNLNKELDNGNVITLEEVKNGLGEELFDLLMKEEIDFAQVIF